MSSGTILESSSSEKRTGQSDVVRDPIEEFSNFREGDCGEPEFTQHLVLDFTPNPEIDNEIVQKKICDFWNFLNNEPDIQNLKVKPVKYETPKMPTTSEYPEQLMPQSKQSVVDMNKTACSMLRVVQDKGMISRAFEARMANSVCSLKTQVVEKTQRKERAHRGPIICECTKPCKPCPVITPNPLKQMCAKMEQWDEKHPKSMDPPGHAPIMKHFVIQRQVFE